jgi:hypothetical protein
MRIIRCVELTQGLYQKALKFAQEVSATTDYSDCSQDKIEKIQQDHCSSKLGEEAVRIHLEMSGWNVAGPDYTIYRYPEKSWASDLYVNRVGVAVKSQLRSSANHFGLSWTFQLAPRRDPILDQPWAWVYFVEIVDTEPGHKCNIFPVQRIENLSFKPPKLDYLIGKKLVVYEEDI